MAVACLFQYSEMPLLAQPLPKYVINVWLTTDGSVPVSYHGQGEYFLDFISSMDLDIMVRHDWGTSASRLIKNLDHSFSTKFAIFSSGSRFLILTGTDGRIYV
jgi:hypothetical protein